MRKPATADARLVGPVRERADQAIALGPLHVVDAGHEAAARSPYCGPRTGAWPRRREHRCREERVREHHVLGVRPR